MAVITIGGRANDEVASCAGCYLVGNVVGEVELAVIPAYFEL